MPITVYCPFESERKKLARFFSEIPLDGILNYGFSTRQWRASTRVWNSPEAVLNAVDKQRTQTILEPEGLCPPSTGEGPFMVKPRRGTKGNGVYLSPRKVTRPGVVNQGYVRASHEFRVIVSLGRVVATLAKYPLRKDASPLVENLQFGWEWQHCPASSSVKEVALRGTKLLGLDVAGIDIGVTGQGPLIFEANSASWVDIDLAWRIAWPFYEMYCHEIQQTTKEGPRRWF